MHAFDTSHLFSVCWVRSGNDKAIALLQKISPVAWQHIHFLGHYTFRENKHLIDLETTLANVTLD